LLLFCAQVGVVSDYDLLALDSISGNRSRETETGLFPEAGRTWKAFKEIQKLLLKTHGKTVGEVMTPSPLVVRESTNLEDAARVLLDTKFRRLPVVDDAGKLVSWCPLTNSSCLGRTIMSYLPQA
jgi:CBS domain-containing protein